jgi:ElaB/YqjD/DUF883 family membrane-anchored ribosome-binding protein
MNTQTPNSPTTASDSKRDALRAKIEASERRIAERTFADDAREAAQAATDYARANPAKVVLGAVAIGLAIGLLTAPGRRIASDAASRISGQAKGTAAKAAKTGQSGFAALLASALVKQGLALIDEVASGVENGRDKLDDLSDKAGTQAQRIGREAAELSGKAATRVQRIGHDAAETTGDFARRTRERAENAARDVAARVKG